MTISIRGLVKVYGSGATAVSALQGLHLEVPTGQICVVRGPNGSGKSTLIGVLVGEIQPTAGTVDVGELGAGSLAVVRQFDNLLPHLDVGEHFRLLGDAAGLSQLAEDWSQRRAAQLARGEAQMVAVSLALSTRPAVLLLDEPTAALSPAEARSLCTFIAQAARAAGSTVLLVTHDAEADAIADQVLSLRDGRISEARGTDGGNQQVVDPLGWMRLPDEVRVGLTSPVTVRETPTGAEIQGLRQAVASTTQARSVRHPASDAVIKVQALTCRYADRTVFRSLSLDIARGGICAITGRSGVGKSTLLRAIAGLHRDITGDVYVDAGHAPLFSADLAFGMHCTPRELGVHEALVPQLALEMLMDRQLRALSGGQRQRALVALALSGSSEVVLLDEPTSSLDDAGVRLVLEAISASPKTVVLATPDDRLHGIATQVVRLGDAESVAEA